MAEQTRVHLVRHGEVYNPDGVLYGRLPGFRLSDKGNRQAQAVAEALSGRDVVAVIASPLQRAQETAAPIAARHSLPVDTDPDLIESANFFEGKHLGPAVLVAAAQSVHPVVGRAVQGDRGPDDDGRVQGSRARRRPRSGVRQPPAAGVDRTAVADRQAALARPAAP
jgi:hypothetical protein